MQGNDGSDPAGHRRKADGQPDGKDHREEETTESKTKMRVITQNVRIAINTIHQALEMIRKTGIEVDMEEEDQEDFYVMTLKIQKHKKGKKN